MSSKKVVYIYALLNPDTKVPFYVGRSVDPNRRFQEHLVWLRIGWMLAKGKRPILKIVHITDSTKAVEREKLWQEKLLIKSVNQKHRRSIAKAHRLVVKERAAIVRSEEKTRRAERNKMLRGLRKLEREIEALN